MKNKTLTGRKQKVEDAFDLGHPRVSFNYSQCQKYVPIGLFIKSPCPFVKGGTYEGLKVYQRTYGCNEQ